MHFFYFFIDDEERAAVNYERKLGKEVLGEVGGGVGRKAFIRRRISLLPLLAMENAMNPLCNATLPVARCVYRSRRCDFFQRVTLLLRGS